MQNVVLDPETGPQALGTFSFLCLLFVGSGGATLWQSSTNALPVCCHALHCRLHCLYFKGKGKGA